MDENLNLYEILKGHEGETFYSPIYGNLTYHRTFYPLIRFKTITGAIYDINANGKVYDNSDELFVFPSKYQRDWNKWVEEQKPKIPKTWSDIVSSEKYDKEVRTIEDVKYYGDDTPIYKSVVALLKIHQLIEVGYNGYIINKEYFASSPKFYIHYNGENFEVVKYLYGFNHITFYSKYQAEEFLSYTENVQLLKDYFMI